MTKPQPARQSGGAGSTQGQEQGEMAPKQARAGSRRRGGARNLQGVQVAWPHRELAASGAERRRGGALTFGEMRTLIVDDGDLFDVAKRLELRAELLRGHMHRHLRTSNRGRLHK